MSEICPYEKVILCIPVGIGCKDCEVYKEYIKKRRSKGETRNTV